MFQGTDNTGHCLLTSESSILGTATISKPVGHFWAAVLHRAIHRAENGRGSGTEAFPAICLSQVESSNSLKMREPQHPSASPSSSHSLGGAEHLYELLSTLHACWAPPGLRGTPALTYAMCPLPEHSVGAMEQPWGCAELCCSIRKHLVLQRAQLTGQRWLKSSFVPPPHMYWAEESPTPGPSCVSLKTFLSQWANKIC